MEYNMPEETCRAIQTKNGDKTELKSVTLQKNEFIGFPDL